jgi:cell division protein FtsA
MGNKQEFVILDISSSKIATVVADISSDGDIIIKDRLLSSCEGLKSSLITDLAKAEESIINAVFALEKKSKILCKEASVSICPTNAQSNYVNAKIRISGQSVTKQDVQKLIHKALAESNTVGRQVIHYFAIDFTLDSSAGITNPVGLLGKELGCTLHIISVDDGVLTNLINCLNQCQILVKDVVLSIYGAALSSVQVEDQQTAVLVIDFGDKVTSFGVLLAGKLLYFGSVPLGSWYITSDIAKAFSISMRSAEKLKLLYGSSKILENNQMIRLQEIDQNEFESNQVISTKDLSAVISPRVEEIFELLKEQYAKLKIDDLTSQNMIATGGGSLLNNISETLSTIFAKNVKVHDATKGHYAQEHLNDSSYSYAVTLGIAKYIAIAQKEKFEIDKNMQSGSSLTKVWRWFKENI